MKTLDLSSLERMLPGAEIDYPSLMSFLGGYYEAPARKLQELLKSGFLIRLKKGFYVLNPEKASRPFRPLAVANLLYGPSYLSLEFAMAHYGLIPERAEEFTSVTSAKSKIYKTAVGTFSYHHLSLDLYPLLTLSETLEGGGNYMIATPEKAVFDFLTLKTKDSEFKTPSELKDYLKEDLRLDWKQFLEVTDSSRIKALFHYERRTRVRWLIEQILREKQ